MACCARCVAARAFSFGEFTCGTPCHTALGIWVVAERAGAPAGIRQLSTGVHHPPGACRPNSGRTLRRSGTSFASAHSQRSGPRARCRGKEAVSAAVVQGCRIHIVSTRSNTCRSKTARCFGGQVLRAYAFHISCGRRPGAGTPANAAAPAARAQLRAGRLSSFRGYRDASPRERRRFPTHPLLHGVSG